jgi:hypothetical protein
LVSTGRPQAKVRQVNPNEDNEESSPQHRRAPSHHRGTRRALKKKGGGLAGPSDQEAKKTGKSESAKVKRAL